VVDGYRCRGEGGGGGCGGGSGGPEGGAGDTEV